MKRQREQALKERAAAALIQWLMYQVHTGEMTLEESYDLQRMMARAVKHPSLTPLFDPDFVKDQIKKRRANGINKPVKLPDVQIINRRAALKQALA